MAGSCCYPKAARLRRRGDFLALQRGGSRKQTPHFVVIRRTESEVARLGVTVSAKVGNSVQRNHVKRRIRESFRLVPADQRAVGPVVVIAKPGAEGLSQRQVAAELDGYLRRGC